MKDRNWRKLFKKFHILIMNFVWFGNLEVKHLSYTVGLVCIFGCWFWGAAMQSQLVCSGCRTILLYPRGATNVCCAVCNVLTPVPPPGISPFCSTIIHDFCDKKYRTQVYLTLGLSLYAFSFDTISISISFCASQWWTKSNTLNYNFIFGFWLTAILKHGKKIS